MSDSLQQQSRLKQLIAKGKEQGYLTYAEVNDHLPQDISEPDQVEDIIQMINDMGIQVFAQPQFRQRSDRPRLTTVHRHQAPARTPEYPWH